MLNVINSVRIQFRLQRISSARARQRKERTKLAHRVRELDALKSELEQLIAQNTSWVADKLMIGMFHGDLKAAQHAFGVRKYWLARKHCKNARATLLCIKRNIRAMRLDPDSRLVIN